MPALIEDPVAMVRNESTQWSKRPIPSAIVFNQTDKYGLDHVNISRELYQSLYSDNDYYVERFASIKLIEEGDIGDFQTYKVNVKEQLSSTTIEFNNITNLMNLNNQITINSCLIIGVPKPLILSEMVLSFPEEVYDLLSRISKDNLFNILNDDDNKIFRKNDFIRNLNGKVVQCEPINQGLINSITKITIVKLKESQVDLIKQPKKDLFENINFKFNNYLSFDEEENAKKFVELKLKTLRSSIKYCFPIPSAKDDNEIFGFVKVNELSRLECFSGDIVQISVAGQLRFIKLFSFPEPNNFEPGSIYISPIYAMNLGSPSSLQVCLSKNTETIPTAKKVTIARILSPVTLNRSYQHLFLSNLKNYFETKNRIIFKNQIIPIPLDSVLAVSLPNEDSENLPEVIPEGNPDTIAWFKVTEIDDGADEDKQYMIDSSCTKMVQSGTLTEAALSNDLQYYQYLGISDIFPFNSSNGDFKYAQTFKKLIKTTMAGPTLKTSILLHSQTRGIGKSLLVKNTSVDLGVHCIELDGYEVLNPGSDMKTIGLIRGKLDRLAQNCSPLIIYFRHIEALTKQKDQQSSNKLETLVLKLSELFDEYLNTPGLIIVASTNDVDSISDSFRSKFKFEIEFNVPTQSERYQIFEYYLKNLNDPDYDYKIREDVSVNSLSLQSAGLTPRDLQSIVSATKDLSLEHLENLADDHGFDFKKLYYLNGGHVNLLPSLFEKAITSARDKFSDSIGAPKIPNVKWEDVGGLDLVKDEILDTIDMPLKHPELFANGLKKRSGILFYGPPGTGKTLLAKAIATNFSLNFFSVKGPELLNMYIGESEANVRKVFQKARDSKPCVVFFDELDSVAPKRGNQGDSGGVMDRIVSQLLAELDGMSSNGGDGVFVVGATNRPDLLDDALLRPGRFDKMLYLGISDTTEKQLKILQALTRNVKLDDSLDLMRIAQGCAFNFTGADFYALCSDAILNSMIRLSSEVDSKIKKFNETSDMKINTRYFFEKLATPLDTEVIVNEEDFKKALDALSPSVSQEELNHYLNIKRNFESG